MMYTHSGNSHDRRKAGRAILHAIEKKRLKTEAATLAVWSPIGLAIGAPSDAILHARESVVPKVVADKMRDPLRNLQLPKDLAPGRYNARIVGSEVVVSNAEPLPKSQPAGFQFIEGASVRNKRTKSVATMVAKVTTKPPYGVNVETILVHRRDNRKVEWPVAECENWNV